MTHYGYRKDTEPLYHYFMDSPVSLPSGIYPLPAMHLLLVTLYVTEYLIGSNQRYNTSFTVHCSKIPIFANGIYEYQFWKNKLIDCFKLKEFFFPSSALSN